MVVVTSVSWCECQVEERKSVDAQAALAAFDRQNHAGASDALAASLQAGEWRCCACHDMMPSVTSGSKAHGVCKQQNT